MATNFPTSLDTYSNPAGTDDVSIVVHSTQHANHNDSIEALEAKVGIDGSADTNSLDYKVNRWDKPIGGATFTYDVDGNVATKTVGATVLTFAYDVDGNVDTITDGSNTKTFTYNMAGNLQTIIYT